MDDSRFEIGHMFSGKYRLLSKLGSGGMGTVYKVHQIFLNKDFALKTMDSRVASDVSLQRFQLEAKAAALLNHPNLVHVHDFGLLDDEQPYLVMDLVNGITFAEHLKESGPISVKNVAAYFAPACFGLLAAHEQGLVHRDIKPGNIMVVTGLPLGSEPSIKVVDFGIAKQTSRDSGEIQALTATGEIFGSPLYMSPEQCIGGAIDHRSDIYSLGCVLFEMLTGTPPYFGQSALSTMMLHESGKPPSLKEASLGTDFPEALERVVAKMLRKAPAERYQNLGLVAHDLAAISRGIDVSTSDRRSTNATKPEKHSNREITISANKLYGLLAVTALIPAVLAWICGSAFKQSQTSTTIVSAAQNLSVTPSAANEQNVSRSELERQQIEKSGPIKASIVVGSDGAKLRMYVFPNCGIGTLFTYDSRNPLLRESETSVICQAQGTTYVPVSKGDLSFRLTSTSASAAVKTPSIFSKISGQEFRKLYISSAADAADEPVGDLAVKARSSRAKNFANVLANLSGWKGLETLDLKQCILRTQAFAELNRLENIQNLGLDSCDFDAQEFVKQPFLVRLKSLSITALEAADGDQVIRQLARSSAINSLGLIVLPNGSMSAAALEQLRFCPNLHKLVIRFKNNKVADDVVKAICQFKNVSHLYLSECTLSIDQIKMFSQFRGSRLVGLSIASYPSMEVRAQIKKIDPGVVFY
ncbi:hypothetical protein BH10CYA1_BH10CYA1_39050 [soil metagenome]